MDPSEITRQRLINQQLAGTTFKSAEEVVGWMGAMQAQDYHWAKWAVGSRLPGSTDAAIERALDEARIIRTHVMRPTWHLVTAADVRWMLALSATHLMKRLSGAHKQMGLTPQLFQRSHAIIEKALHKHASLTRDELVTELSKNKIKPDNLQMIHIMFNAELKGTACNGPRRGKQFTYALLDARVPKSKKLTKEESLGELALRYFSSHGPATQQDFAWWSGLPAADARSAFEIVKSSLSKEHIGDSTVWFKEPVAKSIQPRPVFFLSAYDEFLVSYKDRSASLNDKFFGNAITGNGIFKPIIVKNGEVIGTWSRELKKDTAHVTPLYFRPSFKLKKSELETALPYGDFLERDLKFH